LARRPARTGRLARSQRMDAGWQGADSTLILDQIRNRQFDAALQSIAALEKKAPNSPQPWNFRGLVYLSQQDYPRARENFEKAVKLNPAYLPATANLAELDLYDNKPAAAKARFEAVLKADKSNLDAMLGLAGLANRAGNFTEQLAWLERAHKSAPQAPQPLVLLSNFYLNQGNSAKALVYARQANDAHPNDAAALGVLGDIQRHGRSGSALSTSGSWQNSPHAQPQSGCVWHAPNSPTIRRAPPAPPCSRHVNLIPQAFRCRTPCCYWNCRKTGSRPHCRSPGNSRPASPRHRWAMSAKATSASPRGRRSGLWPRMSRR